jgi:hypothetical protein
MTKGTALILILLAAAIFFTFTSSQWAAAQALAAQAAEYRDVLDNVSRITEARDDLLANYQTIPASEKDRLEKALPDNVDIVGLAKELDAVASRYGIAISRVQVDEEANRAVRSLPGAETGSLPYEKTLVSFTFISNYESFSKFLGDLERSLRVMDVKQVSFQAGEAGVYEHKVTVQTYWLK